MAKSRKSTSRRYRQEAKQRQQRQRWLTIGLVVAGIVVILVLGYMIRQARTPELEDVVLPESLEPPPNADGRNWGPVDAPVLIEEFSDFQ